MDAEGYLTAWVVGLVRAPVPVEALNNDYCSLRAGRDASVVSVVYVMY